MTVPANNPRAAHQAPSQGPPSVPTPFAATLRAHYEALGLTATLRLANVSRRTLFYWLSGEIIPYPSTQRRVLAILAAARTQ